MGEFSKTLDQQQALGLVGGTEKNVLLFGGSRSGKTFILLYAILIRSLKAPGSRHAVFRFRINTARQAIMMDTMPKMMGMCFPEVAYKQNNRDGFFRLSNGSEIWFCRSESVV